MLKVDNIHVSYDEVPALRNVSFSVARGSIVAVVGANGAGKSTILKTVSGLLRPHEGFISFEGTDIGSLPPYRIVENGIAHVPEGRRLFARLSVMKNLTLGAYTKRSEQLRRRTLERVFELFPLLEERKEQLAGTLSGGEQQMLAIARGLMSQPKLLMLDEPSLGIMPKLVDQLFLMIERIKKEENITILLVEQNVREALELADYGYILQTGQVVQHGVGEDLLETDIIRKAYLGL